MSVFFIGFTVGIITTIVGILFLGAIVGGKDVREGKKILKEVESKLDSYDLKFHSRIKNFVYINGYKYTIIYMTDLNKIAIMEGVRVVLSHSILTDMNDKLATKIKERFDKEINNVTVLNGITYSNNILGTDPKSSSGKWKAPGKNKREVYYDTDLILDKISESGYESLTDGEKKWLEDVSNGKKQ